MHQQNQSGSEHFSQLTELFYMEAYGPIIYSYEIVLTWSASPLLGKSSSSPVYVRSHIRGEHKKNLNTLIESMWSSILRLGVGS